MRSVEFLKICFHALLSADEFLTGKIRNPGRNPVFVFPIIYNCATPTLRTKWLWKNKEHLIYFRDPTWTEYRNREQPGEARCYWVLLKEKFNLPACELNLFRFTEGLYFLQFIIFITFAKLSRQIWCSLQIFPKWR